MQYFASGPPESSLSRSSDRSSETSEISEASEAVEASDGLLANNAAAVGNTVDPVVNDRDEEDKLANLLSAGEVVSINWDGNAISTTCGLFANSQTFQYPTVIIGYCHNMLFSQITY